MNRNVAGDLPELERAYYEELKRFQTLCGSLIDGGQPYQVIVLCHELYRFLYPIDPHADFKQTDPVRFSVEHLRKLIALGENLLASVRGYAFEPAAAANESRLETRTSDLYSSLWARFDGETLLVEARKLVEQRIPRAVVEQHVKGKRVLDMGCGSGRYALALVMLGAASVVAADFQAKAYLAAQAHATQAGLPVQFMEADVLALPFGDREFDFVFCNGVLHHTRDWKQGVREYARLMKTAGYLYLYACGGIFWNTRAAVREIFTRIPQNYTQSVLNAIGLPSNRFIFMDTWYVPIEGHLKRRELEEVMQGCGLTFSQLPSNTPFDPDYGLRSGLPGAEIMWGEGEHRYLVTR